MRKIIAILSVWFFLSAVTLASTSAWDKVQAFAKSTNHRLTVNHYNDNYFIEMSDSDLEGAGPTIEDAAEDFLSAMDSPVIEDHGKDTKPPKHWKKPSEPPLIKPESIRWI